MSKILFEYPYSAFATGILSTNQFINELSILLEQTPEKGEEAWRQVELLYKQMPLKRTDRDQLFMLIHNSTGFSKPKETHASPENAVPRSTPTEPNSTSSQPILTTLDATIIQSKKSPSVQQQITTEPQPNEQDHITATPKHTDEKATMPNQATSTYATPNDETLINPHSTSVQSKQLNRSGSTDSPVQRTESTANDVTEIMAHTTAQIATAQRAQEATILNTKAIDIEPEKSPSNTDLDPTDINPDKLGQNPATTAPKPQTQEDDTLFNQHAIKNQRFTPREKSTSDVTAHPNYLTEIDDASIQHPKLAPSLSIPPEKSNLDFDPFWKGSIKSLLSIPWHVIFPVILLSGFTVITFLQLIYTKMDAQPEQIPVEQQSQNELAAAPNSVESLLVSTGDANTQSDQVESSTSDPNNDFQKEIEVKLTKQIEATTIDNIKPEPDPNTIDSSLTSTTKSKNDKLKSDTNDIANSTLSSVSINTLEELHKRVLAALKTNNIEPVEKSDSALGLLETMMLVNETSPFTRQAKIAIAQAYLSLAKDARQNDQWQQAEGYVNRAIYIRNENTYPSGMPTD